VTLRYWREFRSLAVAAIVASFATAACTLLNSLDGFSDGASVPSEGGGPSTSDGGDEASQQRPDATPAIDATVDADAAAGSRYAATVLGDQPLLYYRFGEKSGSPARDEVSGATTPYSLTGMTYGVPGALASDPDTAVTTDGTGILQLTQNADFEGVLPYSVEAWVSPSPTASSGGFIVDHEFWDADRGGWLFRATSTDLTFERYTPVPDAGSQPRAVGAGLTTAAGAWHHLVGTFDGTTMRLYVDAVRVDSGGATAGLPKIGVPFAVGKQNCKPCSGNGFVGTMDELAIYPKALAEDRILAHYAAAR
jgi:hypothetical protein